RPVESLLPTPRTTRRGRPDRTRELHRPARRLTDVGPDGTLTDWSTTTGGPPLTRCGPEPGPPRSPAGPGGPPPTTTRGKDALTARAGAPRSPERSAAQQRVPGAPSPRAGAGRAPCPRPAPNTPPTRLPGPPSTTCGCGTSSTASPPSSPWCTARTTA